MSGAERSAVDTSDDVLAAAEGAIGAATSASESRDEMRARPSNSCAGCIEFDPKTLLPLYWGNLMDGHSYGAEAWANYQAADWWVVTLAFAQLYESLHFKAGSSGLLGIAQAGDDPSHQAHFRSSMNLMSGLTPDVDLRYVSTLPNPNVHAYEELNARLGWQISKQWDAAISGRNLLHAHHQEFTVPPSDAIGRGVMLDARLRF